MIDPLQRLYEVITLISKFSLKNLDSEWIKNVIESDFTEVEDIPLDFEDVHSSTNFAGLFNAIINITRDYIDTAKQSHSVESTKSPTSSLCSSIYEDENKDSLSKFWVDLSESVNIKSLLAFLFYYIHRGQRYDSNEAIRELGIEASSLYFLLLAIPGSNAFRIFHPMLYIKALDILRLITKLNLGVSSPKKGHQRGSKFGHRRSTDDDGDSFDDDEAEVSYLSPVEANKLIRLLNILLNDFLRLIKRFSLKHSPNSLDETISILVEITRCEIHNSQGIFINHHAANTATSLAYNAYVSLQNICDPLHGNVMKTVSIIMKFITNNILMIPPGSSDLSNRALGVIREHSVTFVKYIIIQIGEESHEAAFILVQHLCLRVPDKADYREKTAKSIIEILRLFPLKLYSKLLRWLFKFSHNEKAGHRLFTLEVISKLLYEDERESVAGNESREPVDACPPQETDEDKANTADSPDALEVCILKSVHTDHDVSNPTNRNVLSHKFLLCIIFSRCRDSAASVRAKALALLADCTLANNPAIEEAMKQIFLQPDPVVFNTPHITHNEINCESPQDDFSEEMKLPNADVIMSLLRRRALDDKVTVRKSSLQVMANLMKINNEMLFLKHFSVLVDHCRDPALFIRKQIVNLISSIVEYYPHHDDVVAKWASGVLPLILDPEIKVQEKVVEHVDALVFQRMQPAGAKQDELPWKILTAITKLSLHKFFSKVIMTWAKSEYKNPHIVPICKSHIGGEFNEQTWTLLSMVSQFVHVKDVVFALDYFEANCSLTHEIGSYTLQQVLRVLCHGIQSIPKERVLVLREQLLIPVQRQTINVELISSVIDTIVLITYSLEEEENSHKAIEMWAAPVLTSCDKYLQGILFPKHPAPLSKEEEEVFFRNLFCLGEVAMFCPSKVNKRMFLMLQSIIFHHNHSKLRDKEENDEPQIPSTQTQSTQPPALTFTPTRRLKALAVVTLGKMCLQHEDQAKRIIPALGRMLDTTVLPSLKINIIFVLSDMCVRYATLVDPLMPQVTACLRDDDIQVRRTTLTLLINLLQEDYLKLKGSFFYRILQCLTDDHEDIRSTVVFFMIERLLKRFPKLFLQHFIECIFHYNCYEEHESYNKFTQTKQEKELFSLAGPQHRNKRMDLYRFMLDHMPDDQRFATTQRLCQDVLGGVVDGRIKLTASSLPMLEDTMMVLSSEEIKLAWLKSRPEENDQPTDQAEQAEMAGIVIKKTIISQVVKRNVIENIVPILIALKQRLAEQRSPLMKQLLLYFKEIMKDYKNEMKEILAGDRQLMKEIEFDLRKIEEQQKEEEKDRHVENMKRSIDGSPKLYAAPEVRRNGEQAAISPRRPSDPPIKLSSPKKKSPSKNLLKQALINSKKKRKSLPFASEELVHQECVPMSSPPQEKAGGGVSRIQKCLVNLERASLSTVSEIPLHQYASKATGDLTSHSNELLRAISTPDPTRKEIHNITFMDKTQEISAIGIDDSQCYCVEKGSGSDTLVLHFRSPEEFAKDKEFSKLRKTSKKSLESHFSKEVRKSPVTNKNYGEEEEEGQIGVKAKRKKKRIMAEVGEEEEEEEVVVKAKRKKILLAEIGEEEEKDQVGVKNKRKKSLRAEVSREENEGKVRVKAKRKKNSRPKVGEEEEVPVGVNATKKKSLREEKGERAVGFLELSAIDDSTSGDGCEDSEFSSVASLPKER